MIKLSSQKANVFSTGVFLICLGILAYINWWWPGMLIALWLLFATRQFLTRRINDLFVTSLIFLVIFATFFVQVNWEYLGPLLLVLAGTYIILREYFYKDSEKTIIQEKQIIVKEDSKNKEV